jgi:hypothetical protein
VTRALGSPFPWPLEILFSVLHSLPHEGEESPDQRWLMPSLHVGDTLGVGTQIVIEPKVVVRQHIQEVAAVICFSTCKHKGRYHGCKVRLDNDSSMLCISWVGLSSVCAMSECWWGMLNRLLHRSINKQLVIIILLLWDWLWRPLKRRHLCKLWGFVLYRQEGYNISTPARNFAINLNVQFNDPNLRILVSTFQPQTPHEDERHGEVRFCSNPRYHIGTSQSAE